MCATRAVGLVPTGQASEDPPAASANSVKVARTRATRASQWRAPRTALLAGWRSRPFDSGVRQANMPRLSGPSGVLFEFLIMDTWVDGALI